jgi:hypothetical protein
LRFSKGYNPWIPEEFAMRGSKANNALLARQFAWRIENALNIAAYEAWEDNNHERAPIYTTEEAAKIVAKQTSFDRKHLR